MPLNAKQSFVNISPHLTDFTFTLQSFVCDRLLVVWLSPLQCLCFAEEHLTSIDIIHAHDPIAGLEHVSDGHRGCQPWRQSEACREVSCHLIGRVSCVMIDVGNTNHLLVWLHLLDYVSAIQTVSLTILCSIQSCHGLLKTVSRRISTSAVFKSLQETSRKLLELFSDHK